jgi:hypothetical protein
VDEKKDSISQNMSEEQPTSSQPWRLASGQMITGILLVLLGIILLLAQLLGRWFISGFWPFFLIVGGLIFYAGYFARSDKPSGYEGMLFPGTYLVVLGVMFLVMNILGWYYMRYLWPTFVLGVALSLWSMYLFGPAEPEKKRSDLLSSIKVLTIISVVLYLIAIGGMYLWPLALIVVGLIIILRGFIK